VSARRPGRTQKIAYDETPLNAASPDIEARIGGLLAGRRGHFALFGGLFTGRALAALAQALTLVLLARVLRPADFSVVAALLGVLAFLIAICDLGVTTATTRSIAADEHRLVPGLRRLNLSAAGVGAATTAICLAVYQATSSFEQAIWFPLFGIWIGLDRLAEFRLSVLIGLNQSAAVAGDLVIRKVLPVAFVVPVALLAPDYVVLALAAGYIVGSGLTALRGLGYVAKLNAGDRSMLKTLQGTLPFWVNSMAAQSRQLDVVVVGVFGGAAAAAVYAPVSRLIAPLRLLPTTIASAALAVWSRAHASNAEKPGRRMLMSTILPSAVLFAVVGALAEPAIKWLLGPEYVESVAPLQIVLFGLIFAATSSMLTSLLQAQQREKFVATANSLTAIVSLAFIALGSALGGAVGASLGLAFGYAVQMVVLVMGRTK
jgi:O-antigen/teichoic acid export membrane protein